MQTGRKKYGYYPDEQAVINVIKIKRRARKGASGPTSFARIARELNDEGYKTISKKPWYPQIVRKIIDRIEKPEEVKKTRQIPKPCLGIHDYLDSEQLKKCRAVCPERDRMIFEVLVTCGIRACELCAMKIGDIDLGKRKMDIRGKGGHGKVTRTIKIATVLTRRIGKYLKENRSNAGSKEPVFLNIWGRPMKYKCLLDRIKSIAKKADIDWLRPHKLRHTAAFFLYNYKKDLLAVKDYLGHSSVKTTEIYAKTAEIDNEDQAEGLFAALNK